MGLTESVSGVHVHVGSVVLANQLKGCAKCKDWDAMYITTYMYDNVVELYIRIWFIEVYALATAQDASTARLSCNLNSLPDCKIRPCGQLNYLETPDIH